MAKIFTIIKNDLCLGCGICEALNKNSCKMKLNKRGFYQPEFCKNEADLNIDCIDRLCPGINIRNSNIDKSNSIWGNVELISNAWAKDVNIRFSSSSGGVTSALAIYLLESHQVDAILHVGVQNDSFLYNKLFVSRTREDILKRNASRYAPAAVFNDIIDIFKAAPLDTFAFIGKPCDIAAMQNLISEFPLYKDKIKYYLAIFCAGMPSYNATKKALSSFNKKQNPLVLRYRGDGWPGYFTAIYADGSMCRMTYNDSWGKILGRDLGFRCKICPDGIGLLADIALGDSWNTKDGYPDFTDADGKNFCFIRTKKGAKLFAEAKDAGYIETEEMNIDDVRKMQRYQYERRHLVGWRIAIVQFLSGGILNYQGLGFYKTALRTNLLTGLRDLLGTAKRFAKIKRGYGK